jgi:hypothetical protein
MGIAVDNGVADDVNFLAGKRVKRGAQVVERQSCSAPSELELFELDNRRRKIDQTRVEE